MNEIFGRKGSSRRRIRSSCPKERIKLWKEHFEGLLGQPIVVADHTITRVFDTLPIKTGDFTNTELQEAISIQGNKATGLDSISEEVWKLECFNDQLPEVCNKAYHGDIPDMWLKGAILPFPKKGDRGSASNYRYITLMAVGTKICNRMLLDRIRPLIDLVLRNNQNSFRKGWSTVAQILTLRGLVEGIKSKTSQLLSLLLISISRLNQSTGGKLMEILKAYEFPVEIVDAANMMNANTTAQVLSPDVDSLKF